MNHLLDDRYPIVIPLSWLQKGYTNRKNHPPDVGFDT